MSRPSFLRHAVVYGAGHLLVYAGSFLLLPLYVRCLDKSDYGILDIFNRLGEVLLLCLLYNGLRQALLAFYNQSKTEQEKRAVVGSALALTSAMLVLGGGVFLVFAESISRLLDTGSPHLLRLATVSVGLESLALMLLALAQARVESLFFSTMSVLQFLIRVGLSILLVASLGWGIEGVLLASIASSALLALCLFVRECRRGLGVDRKQLRAMTWFALPFIPGGLGFFLLNSGDRFFLLRWWNAEEVAVYALGYKLALVVKLFSRRPLYMVWSARMYGAARQPDAPQVFGEMFTRIMAAYVFVGLALCLVQAEVVQFLAGAGYAAAATIIAPVVLAYYCLTAADLMDAAFYVQRRTAWKTPVTLASTVVMLVLYALLIPPFGAMGGALATLGGFVFHLAVTGVVSQRIFPVRYEWRRVVTSLGLAVALWGVGQVLPVHWGLLPVKLGLLLLWPLLLWRWGIVTDAEKNLVRAQMQTWRERWQQLGVTRLSPPSFRGNSKAAA